MERRPLTEVKECEMDDEDDLVRDEKDHPVPAQKDHPVPQKSVPGKKI